MKKKKSPKLKKERYTLKKDVSIGGKINKKGSSIYLTEQGKKSFNKLNYI